MHARFPVGLLLALPLALALGACKPAEEAALPEIRPVRVVTVEKRMAGDTVQLTIRRGNGERELPLTLGTRPPENELQPQREDQP
ncbi:MAG: serine protease [Blastochloris sp.]|nr:serine protease [Blastochloris sp.]